MQTNPSDAVVALVTGGGRGLGRGISLQLAELGCSVAINYSRNAAAAAATADDCRRAARSGSQKFVTVQADVGVAADRSRLVEQTLGHFGRIDALVNNAGMAPRARADIVDATEESFLEVIGTNLQGPYFLTQLVARHWIGHPAPQATGSARTLVFVTSISADTASVNRGDYCISKAGLAMAAQLWASRLAAAGIVVVEVRPGIMATDMTAGAKERYDGLISDGLVPQGRWGTPEDVGRAVRAVVAGDLAFSTGSVIHVDGGFSIRRL